MAAGMAETRSMRTPMAAAHVLPAGASALAGAGVVLVWNDITTDGRDQFFIELVAMITGVMK